MTIWIRGCRRARSSANGHFSGMFVLLVATMLSIAPADAFGPYREADLPASKRAPHGALAMEEQAKSLDRLLSDHDVTAVPAEIDPEMWARRLANCFG